MVRSKKTQEHPLILLRLLSTASDTIFKNVSREKLCINNSVAMACDKADFAPLRSRSIAFNPAMTVHGRKYNYFGAMISPEDLSQFFYFYFRYGQCQPKQLPNSPNLISRLHTTPSTYSADKWVQPLSTVFCCLRDGATLVDASNPNQVIIHNDKLPSGKCVRPCSRPQKSEIAAVIPGPKIQIARLQDIVICRCGQHNKSGSEHFATIPSTQRSYDSLTDVFFLPHGTNGCLSGLSPSNFSSQRRRAPKLSPLMFHSLRLFQHTDEFKTVREGVCLFCQYVVDYFCKLKWNAFNLFVKTGQRCMPQTTLH